MVGVFGFLHADAPLPPYQELLELIRSQAPDLPMAELDTVATSALLSKVRGRILAAGEPAEHPSTEPEVVQQRIYSDCAYIRVGQVTPALTSQLAAALQNETFSKAHGLILDLRFAVGTDYRAATQVVDLFLSDETPLLTWGDQAGRSSAKTNAWKKPVIVLVNHDTRGAAEALAAALRQQSLGMILGGRTAGMGAVFKEIPLPGGSGNRLLLAVAPVKTADGKPLSASGLEPDIEVKTRPELERAYLADPYAADLPGATATAAEAGTNAPNYGFTIVRKAPKRVSEADLVRQKREADAGIRGSGAVGTASGTSNAPASNPKSVPAEAVKVMKDPVLGRAIDLLKGLSLLDAQRK